MGKTIKYLIGCVVILMLAACSSQELLGEATPEIPTSSPAVPTETNMTTPTVPKPTNTPSPTNTLAPTSTATPTVELATYRNEELNMQLSYPAEWQEISEGVFAGDDGGYMIIKKVEDSKYRNMYTDSVIFTQTNYAEYDPYLFCGPGLGPGCEIIMNGPDIYGNEIEKIVGLLGVYTPGKFQYFTLEAPFKDYEFISQTIVSLYVRPTVTPTTQYAETPTRRPTPVPSPIQLNLLGGITLTEVWGQEFERTDDYYAEPVVYCGHHDPALNMKGDQYGRVYIYRDGEIVYQLPTYNMMVNDSREICLWEDNWMIESSGVVVVNGEILNEKYDLDQIFYWHLLGGKPLFFAEKDDRYYVYYDGAALPVEYDGISHNLCCGAAFGNPHTTGQSTWFSAGKDGVGYWVKISVDSD